MRDEGKTKEQLMDELVELRQRIAEMEASEAEIKKVGEALRKSEARLAAAQRISHIGSWEWDIIKNELNWSDEVYRIFGLEPYEFGATYDTFIESVHPGDRETVKKYVNEALYKKRPYGIDHRIVLPDGTERIVHEQAEVIYDEAGRSIRMIGTVQDITESKRLEEELDKMEAQLRHAQKIEAIGQLAGGVAHDFNNLMTVIQGNTDLALMKIGEEEPVHRNLKEIGRVTAKAAALTRQLLTFSRRQPVSKEILNINKAVLEMSKILHLLIGENISLSTELSPDLWNTEADPGQLEQLLMNLVVNARDAMPNGGKLLIKTENARIDETYRQIYGEGHPGRFVQISVEDTGTGMDAETRAHIFDPFFTTKGIGKGTGLGLSVVYGIVKAHDGWINVYSEPGNGTNFRIYLPAASGGIEEKGDKPKASEIRSGNERILLVEDEEDVRELALLMLERQGYKVFVASTFDEAVSVFKEEGGRLDLMFSDIMLTDRSGLELAEELRRHRPNLKVLLTSGYSGEHFQLLEGHKKDFGFLEKPYSQTDLL